MSPREVERETATHGVADQSASGTSVNGPNPGEGRHEREAGGLDLPGAPTVAGEIRIRRHEPCGSKTPVHGLTPGRGCSGEAMQKRDGAG